MKKTMMGFLLAFSVCVHADETMTLEFKQNVKHFEVTLAANPTTGYQWAVKSFDKKRYTLIKSEFKRPQTNLIGAGGEMIFVFNLIKGKTNPDQTALVFNYARPWEANSGSIKNVKIHFTK